MSTTVIVGAGHAGVELADALRRRGHAGQITMLTAETELPYQRPPLSKDYLGTQEAEPLPLRGDHFYRTNEIDLRRGAIATNVDTDARVLKCADGSHLPYDELVLATGARNRVLTVPGAAGDGVRYLRTAREAALLQRDLAAAKSVVVVGAGFIGLEFAAAAAARGVAVTVLEYGGRPLARALSEPTSAFLTATHRATGIDLHFNVSVAMIERTNGLISAVMDDSNTRYPADLVVVGIGAEPDLALARSAGIEIDNGVRVDQTMRTSNERIWAIGDCVSFPCAYEQAWVRRESVQNAVDQARSLAATLTGTPTPYTDVPWFWSHQGACKIQIAGASGCIDQVIVPTGQSPDRFSTFCFRDDVLVVVESVNQPAVHLAARKVLSSPHSPHERDLVRYGFDLKEYAKSLTAA